MANNNADPERQAQPSADGFPFKLAIDPASAAKPLTLEQFRALVGIPQEQPDPRNISIQSASQTTGTGATNSNLDPSTGQHTVYPPLPIRPATITSSTLPTQGSRLFIAFGLLTRPKFSRRNDNSNDAAEYATSLYYTIIREESDQARLAHFYDIVTYTCLIGQLVIASVLIILAAIPFPSNSNGSGHRIPIAVLGAVTGLLTGLMSLLKGQGLPMRLQQYGTRLRQLRDKLEFMERTLRANVGAIITLKDTIDLWNEFEQVRNEQAMNRPNVWTTASTIPAIAGLQQWSDEQTSRILPTRTMATQGTEQQPLIRRGNNNGPTSPSTGTSGGLSNPRDPPIPSQNRGSSAAALNGASGGTGNSNTAASSS